MDKQYISQPTNKPSKCIFSKSKSLKSNTKGSSDPLLPEHHHESFQPNVRPATGVKKRQWAILDDESDNWSNDVLEFYNNGDSTFCYLAVFFTNEKLDKQFWGTLLGCYHNGHLSSKCWVGRLIKWRFREVQKNPCLNLRWTILPPSFVNFLLDSCSKNATNFANGKHTPFPSFFEVDYVYFPYCFKRQDWILLKIDLNTQELVLYDNKCMIGEEYRSNFHLIMVKIAVYFTALLVNIRYWKVTRHPERSITFGMNDDFVRSPNELYGNEVVYVFMLMEHLVTRKPINLEIGFKIVASLTDDSWPMKFIFCVLYRADCKTRISWKNVEIVKQVIERKEEKTEIRNGQCIVNWLNKWIYECFPYMKTVCQYNEAIPRAIGWEKLHRTRWPTVEVIFQKSAEVIFTSHNMIPTLDEMQVHVESFNYLNNALQMRMSRNPNFVFQQPSNTEYRHENDFNEFVDDIFKDDINVDEKNSFEDSNKKPPHQPSSSSLNAYQYNNIIEKLMLFLKNQVVSNKGRGKRLKKKSKLLQTPYQGFESTSRIEKDINEVYSRNLIKDLSTREKLHIYTRFQPQIGVTRDF
ncbi:hypothetical protein R6Q59_003017 [Mikania micrantha]